MVLGGWGGIFFSTVKLWRRLMTNRTHKACGPVQLGGLLLAERAVFLPPGAAGRSHIYAHMVDVRLFG